MHYDKCAFTNNNEMTIKTKDPFYENLIGQRMTASPQDIQMLDVMYDPSSNDLTQCRCKVFEVSGFHSQGHNVHGVYYLDGTAEDKLLYGHGFIKFYFCGL